MLPTAIRVQLDMLFNRYHRHREKCIARGKAQWFMAAYLNRNGVH